VGYYEIEPDAVYSAARAAYGTATSWQVWANSAQRALDEATSATQEFRVQAAFATYLADVQPMLSNLPVLAASQGSETAQAVNVVTDAQTESLAIYSGMYDDSVATNSLLTRPLDAE
jgi:hypothetical protein